MHEAAVKDKAERIMNRPPAGGGPGGARPPGVVSPSGAAAQPFSVGGSPHTATVSPDGAVTIRSLPQKAEDLVAEVDKATRNDERFTAARAELSERKAAVLAAERAVKAAPPEGKSAALRVLTDAIVALVTTKAQTSSGKEAKIPGYTTTEGDPRSMSTSHYEIRVGSESLSGTSVARSGEIKPILATGEPAGSRIEQHQVGIPIASQTLRASDAAVFSTPGRTKGEEHQQQWERREAKLQEQGLKGQKPRESKLSDSEPTHWRGHDSELKLIAEIDFKLKPFLKMPGGDFARSAVVSPEVTGSVWVHSDFVICDSCKLAIWDFSRRFPNVRFIATSSDRLTPAAAERMLN
jgi:hypothetical protein